jgi:hypothetical protein
VKKKIHFHMYQLFFLFYRNYVTYRIRKWIDFQRKSLPTSSPLSIRNGVSFTLKTLIWIVPWAGSPSFFGKFSQSLTQQTGAV